LRYRLRRCFRRHRPDIVHTFLFGFDLAANRAARDTGVPVVISSRRELADWQLGRHLRRQRLANRYVDCIVANSRAVADYAIEREKTNPALFRIIPNGILADEFVSMADPEQVRQHYHISPNRHVVCTVANFSPVKDYPLFVAMAAELTARRDDVHFLAIGDGPLKQETGKLIHKYRLKDRFTQARTVQGIPDLLKVASVFVLTSKLEGFPNAVMEAMAAGKAIVAAQVGGVPELISEGETGRLIAGRDPIAFADAVDSLLNRPEERAAIGTNAAQWVRERLPIEALAQAHRYLYAELLAQSARKVG